MQIKLEDTIAVMIDFQERLVPVIARKEEILANTIRLLDGLKVLKCPVLFTQQYTKGLGMTVQEVQDTQESFQYIEKHTFSGLQTVELVEALQKSKKKTVLIAGLESHICVMQTVRDLIKNGYQVAILSDCIGSRTDNNYQVGMERMRQEGAIVTSVESVLFELLEEAGSEQFKKISKIIK